MFKSVVPISTSRHGGKKLRPITDYRFAAEQHLCPIVAAEFPRAASSYPIVFLKDEQGDMGAFALLGVQQGKNLFVDDEGRWHAAYVPAAIRRYPFIFSRTQEADTFTLCIDEGADLLSDEEGQPLFSEENEPAEPLKKAMDFLKGFQVQHQQTEALCRVLSERDMFRALQIQAQVARGRQYTLRGIFAVDETKLNALPGEDFLEWRKRGWLPLVYAHLTSIGQVALLVERVEQQQRRETNRKEESGAPIVH
ncbi:MAG: SapC family protein [Nitrospiraceae bacterium]